MNCATTRRRLIEDPEDPELASHLEGCLECRAFAQRRAAVGVALGAAREAHRPDASFSARVLARRGGSVELLGLAAWRLMPAAVALILAAAWASLTAPPSLVDLMLHPEQAAVLLLAAGDDASEISR